ncbi:hypothetical protein B296_00001087 [Ensete ventricosum]|uniref:Uncharacterized protein n=1 Tax=Ensete ventricosum TaxID=4639 RepID=A0A426Y523_ENSVE|nr:hypothetical protein B296_00001087 [Ensete ventricosum]
MLLCTATLRQRGVAIAGTGEEAMARKGCSCCKLARWQQQNIREAGGDEGSSRLRGLKAVDKGRKVGQVGSDGGVK